MKPIDLPDQPRGYPTDDKIFVVSESCEYATVFALTSCRPLISQSFPLTQPLEAGWYMDSYIEFPSPAPDGSAWLGCHWKLMSWLFLANGPGVFSGKPQRGVYCGSAEHVVDY